MAVILTVEDELPIRLYLGELLEAEGYEVIAAANADEAITILEARTDILILITDVNMPGSMDGLKLAAAVRNRWPPIKIVIATGRGRPAREEMPADSRFLPKPYVPEVVLATIRQLQ